jgi:hypothetical protein
MQNWTKENAEKEKKFSKKEGTGSIYTTQLTS